MLEELNIENVALIEKASLKFTQGLNVLTGETGAGKSILLGALGLLLGERADRSLIRKGCDEANVSAIMTLKDNPDIQEWCQTYGIKTEEGQIILRRNLKDSGRSQVYIQSQPVNLQALKELSELLFDVHGQHQHQSLFRIESHRKLLDRYGGLEAQVQALSLSFRELTALREELNQWEEQEQQRSRERELAGFALEEIESAQLKPGEEESLMERLKLMEKKEHLAERFKHYDSAMQGEGGVLNILKNLQAATLSLASLNEEGDSLASRFDSAYYELEDISETYQDWMSAFDFSPQEQLEAEQRLAQIHKLQKKYAPTVEGLLDYAEQCRVLIDQEEISLKDHGRKLERKKELENRIRTAAQELSAARGKVGAELEKKVEGHLHDLGMSSAEFRISLHGRTNMEGQQVYGPTGCDQVEFLFCANKGGDLRPLKSVASGGELSRIMLALKTAFASADQIETLIFDEIDSGIGGQVALAIGSHFRKLSRHKQIFCITHLASIASFADNHIRVIKKEDEQGTITCADVLDPREKVEEIARMLAGDSLGELSLRHAQELLDQNSPAAG